MVYASSPSADNTMIRSCLGFLRISEFLFWFINVNLALVELQQINLANSTRPLLTERNCFSTDVMSCHPRIGQLTVYLEPSLMMQYLNQQFLDWADSPLP